MVKTNKIQIKYKCRWCGHSFEKAVGSSGGDKKNDNKKIVSDQVKCPKCQNFIKTWQ